MFCIDELKESYSPLTLKPKVKQPSTNIEGNLLKVESEKNHFAQMIAMLSGIGLGLFGKSKVFAEGYSSEIKYNVQISDPGMIPVNASGDMVDKVASAFDPLMNLIIGLSVPIAGIMLAAGALAIMIGQKEQGYKLLINCGMGYVLVNLTPLFLDILKMVGESI